MAETGRNVRNPLRRLGFRLLTKLPEPTCSSHESAKDRQHSKCGSRAIPGQGFESLSLRQNRQGRPKGEALSVFYRNCLPFHFARKPLISGLFRYPAIKKQPLRSHFRSGIIAFSGVPSTPLPDKSFSQRGIVQFEVSGSFSAHCQSYP